MRFSQTWRRWPSLWLLEGSNSIHINGSYKWEISEEENAEVFGIFQPSNRLIFEKLLANLYHRKNKMLYRCFVTGNLYFRRGLSERRLLLRLPRVQDTFLTIPPLSSHLNVLPASAPLQHGPGAPTELLFIWHFDQEVCASSWAQFLQPLPKSCQRVWTRSWLQFLCGWRNHASQLIGRLLSCL